MKEKKTINNIITIGSGGKLFKLEVKKLHKQMKKDFIDWLDCDWNNFSLDAQQLVIDFRKKLKKEFKKRCGV